MTAGESIYKPMVSKLLVFPSTLHIIHRAFTTNYIFSDRFGEGETGIFTINDPYLFTHPTYELFVHINLTS